MGTLSKKPWNLQSAASSSTLKVSTNPVDWYQNLQDAPGDNLQGWVSQGFSSESIYGDHGGSLMLGVLGPMLRTATTDKKDKRTGISDAYAMDSSSPSTAHADVSASRGCQQLGLRGLIRGPYHPGVESTCKSTVSVFYLVFGNWARRAERERERLLPYSTQVGVLKRVRARKATIKSGTSEESSCGTTNPTGTIGTRIIISSKSNSSYRLNIGTPGPLVLRTASHQKWVDARQFGHMLPTMHYAYKVGSKC